MTRLVVLALVAVGVLGSGRIIRAESFTFSPINVPGAVSVTPSGINNDGQIIGTYLDSSLTAHAFLDTQGVFSDINLPGAVPTSTNLNGINDSGQIVGWASAPNPVNSSGIVAFIDYNGVFSTINAPGFYTYFTWLQGINDKGQIVGFSQSFPAPGYPPPPYPAFIYSKGVFAIIDIPGSGGAPTGINNKGQIVGNFVDSAGEGFLDTNGVYTPITYPGSIDTTVQGINDAGEIVGTASVDSGRSLISFIYADGVFTPFRYPLAGTTTTVDGIDDAGQIVGSYMVNGQSLNQIGFIATPIPEPGSLLLLGCGLAGAAFSGMRHRGGAQATRHAA